MNTTKEIDRIVEEVIRRLRETSVDQPTSTLRLTAPLITLSTIEGKLSGIRQLLVPKKAVLTPSVRDELRNHGIQVERRDQDPPANAKTLLTANLGNTDRSPLLKTLTTRTQLAEPQTVQLSLERMARQLTETTRGLVLSDEPEEIACLSNRHKTIRAFVGHDLKTVRRAKSFRGNLMVVDANAPDSLVGDLVRTFMD